MSLAAALLRALIWSATKKALSLARSLSLVGPLSPLMVGAIHWFRRSPLAGRFGLPAAHSFNPLNWAAPKTCARNSPPFMSDNNHNIKSR